MKFKLKDPGSAITHGIALLLAAVGAVPLIIKAARSLPSDGGFPPEVFQVLSVALAFSVLPLGLSVDVHACYICNI